MSVTLASMDDEKHWCCQRKQESQCDSLPIDLNLVWIRMSSLHDQSMPLTSTSVLTLYFLLFQYFWSLPSALTGSKATQSLHPHSPINCMPAGLSLLSMCNITVLRGLNYNVVVVVVVVYFCCHYDQFSPAVRQLSVSSFSYSFGFA